MIDHSEAGQSLTAVFNKAFKLLLVDDEDLLLSLVKTLFEDLPVFDLATARSVREADHCLSHQRQHLCFCDLGITDHRGDQYYLLKKYHKDMPFIILSGRASMEHSAHCMYLGASWVIDKPEALTKEFFEPIIRRFLPRSLFLYGTNCYQHSRYPEAVEMLLTEKPRSVEEWARILNINERYLRKICTCCPLPLHQMVNVCHLLDCLLTNDGCGAAVDACDMLLRDKKLVEFYYLNKSALDAFFRFDSRPVHYSLKKQ